MSKIGRKAIPINSALVTVNGNIVTIKGAKIECTHVLPDYVQISQIDKSLQLSIKENTRKNRMEWGLHRALLANKIKGAEEGFEKKVTIVGLGYKAEKHGSKLVFSLGYSHKIDYEIAQGVTVDVDKSGQNLVFKSHDKFLLGNVCDGIRSLKKPEPYKGKGIILEGEVLIRKVKKAA